MIQSVVAKEGKRRGNGGEEEEVEVARRWKSVEGCMGGRGLGGHLAEAGLRAWRETHTHTHISTEISNSRHTRVHIITFTHMHAHAEKP